MRIVREGIAAQGVALFEPHPGPKEIVRYAIRDETLSSEDLARIGAHARACPACRREIELTRGASSRAGGWSQRAAELLFPGEPHGAWSALRPALAAVLLIAALFPSYLGLVELPKSRALSGNAEREARSLREQKMRLRSDLEASERRLSAIARAAGGVRFLYLGGTRRGLPAATPVIPISTGRLFQPVLVEFDLADDAEKHPDGLVRISVWSVARDTATWIYEARISDVWDPATQMIGLLIPTDAVPPGDYRLELRHADRPSPAYSGRFRTIAPSGR